MATTERTARCSWLAFVAALLLAISAGPARADDPLVVLTYVEYQGRIIELTDISMDEVSILSGVLLAIDNTGVPEASNIDGFDHDDTILREWKRDGDDAIRIFFREDARFIRFPMDRVKVRVIERPWMDPWPEPLTVEPV